MTNEEKKARLELISDTLYDNLLVLAGQKLQTVATYIGEVLGEEVNSGDIARSAHKIGLRVDGCACNVASQTLPSVLYLRTFKEKNKRS